MIRQYKMGRGREVLKGLLYLRKITEGSDQGATGFLLMHLMQITRMTTSAKMPQTPPTDTSTMKTTDAFSPAKVKETDICQFWCLDGTTKEACSEIKRLQTYVGNDNKCI